MVNSFVENLWNFCDLKSSCENYKEQILQYYQIYITPEYISIGRVYSKIFTEGIIDKGGNNAEKVEKKRQMLNKKHLQT